MGAGGGFGVILDRKGGKIFHFQAFDGLVVEAAVGHVDCIGIE